jgi:hypothetical protein
MQHNEMKTNTEQKTKTAHEWVGWVTTGIEIKKPSGVDDAHWAELTPKQKAVVAHRLICISEYRKEMK